MTSLELELKCAYEKLADLKKECDQQAELCWYLRGACEEERLHPKE